MYLSSRRRTERGRPAFVPCFWRHGRKHTRRELIDHHRIYPTTTQANTRVYRRWRTEVGATAHPLDLPSSPTRIRPSFKPNSQTCDVCSHNIPVLHSQRFLFCLANGCHDNNKRERNRNGQGVDEHAGWGRTSCCHHLRPEFSNPGSGHEHRDLRSLQQWFKPGYQPSGTRNGPKCHSRTKEGQSGAKSKSIAREFQHYIVRAIAQSRITTTADASAALTTILSGVAVRNPASAPALISIFFGHRSLSVQGAF